MKEVITAQTAGFCFGVRRAVDIAYKAAEESTRPVYTFGPIIHNENVVADLKEHGVDVIENDGDLDRISGADIIIRSHGAPPEITEAAGAGGNRVIDATCPFVKRIHDIVVSEREAGRRIIIVGDPSHPEVTATKGWAGDEAVVIESAEEIGKKVSDLAKRYSLVAQTTCNYSKFQEIVAKLQSMKYDINYFNTVCNATQERQREAADLAAVVDVMIVIGGSQSSNTHKLYEICRERCPRTFLVGTVDDLYGEHFETAQRIGITAGASTPKHIIEEVQNYVRA